MHNAKKVFVYYDQGSARFQCLYVKDDGTFEFGPSDNNIQDVAETLARQLWEKHLANEEQRHIIFPNEDLVYYIKFAQQPILHFFKAITEVSVRNEFFNSLRKRMEELSA